MSKTLVVMMAACVFATASVFAAPRALSSAEMDGVAAGVKDTSTAIDLFASLFAIPTDTTANAAQAPMTTDTNAHVNAVGDGSIATAATNDSTVVAAGAVANNDAAAINGDHNLNISLGGNLALGFAAAGANNFVADMEGSENAVLATNNANVTATNVEKNRVDDGSALVAGINNTTTVSTDKSEVEGRIDDGSDGVIARVATVCDSFNIKDVDTDVKAKIDDSFNNTKNEMDISGQCNLSAIVNANTLGDANVATNLNVTTAKSDTSSDQSGSAGFQASIPLVSGNAIALTIQNQVVSNNVLIADNSAVLITK